MLILFYLYVIFIYYTKGVKVDNEFQNLSKDIPYSCQDYSTHECVNLLWDTICANGNLDNRQDDILSHVTDLQSLKKEILLFPGCQSDHCTKIITENVIIDENGNTDDIGDCFFKLVNNVGSFSQIETVFNNQLSMFNKEKLPCNFNYKKYAEDAGASPTNEAITYFNDPVNRIEYTTNQYKVDDCTIYKNYNLVGTNQILSTSLSFADCIESCRRQASCVQFTYDKVNGQCTKFSGESIQTNADLNLDYVSGSCSKIEPNANVFYSHECANFIYEKACGTKYNIIISGSHSINDRSSYADKHNRNEIFDTFKSQCSTLPGQKQFLNEQVSSFGNNFDFVLNQTKSNNIHCIHDDKNVECEFNKKRVMMFEWGTTNRAMGTNVCDVEQHCLSQEMQMCHTDTVLSLAEQLFNKKDILYETILCDTKLSFINTNKQIRYWKDDIALSDKTHDFTIMKEDSLVNTNLGPFTLYGNDYPTEEDTDCFDKCFYDQECIAVDVVLYNDNLDNSQDTKKYCKYYTELPETRETVTDPDFLSVSPDTGLTTQYQVYENRKFLVNPTDPDNMKFWEPGHNDEVVLNNYCYGLCDFLGYDDCKAYQILLDTDFGVPNCYLYNSLYPDLEVSPETTEIISNVKIYVKVRLTYFNYAKSFVFSENTNNVEKRYVSFCCKNSKSSIVGNMPDIKSVNLESCPNCSLEDARQKCFDNGQSLCHKNSLKNFVYDDAFTFEGIINEDLITDTTTDHFESIVTCKNLCKVNRDCYGVIEQRDKCSPISIATYNSLSVGLIPEAQFTESGGFVAKDYNLYKYNGDVRTPVYYERTNGVFTNLAFDEANVGEKVQLYKSSAECTASKTEEPNYISFRKCYNICRGTDDCQYFEFGKFNDCTYDQGNRLENCKCKIVTSCLDFTYSEDTDIYTMSNDIIVEKMKYLPKDVDLYAEMEDDVLYDTCPPNHGIRWTITPESWIMECKDYTMPQNFATNMVQRLHSSDGSVDVRLYNIDDKALPDINNHCTSVASEQACSDNCLADNDCFAATYTTNCCYKYSFHLDFVKTDRPGATGWRSYVKNKYVGIFTDATNRTYVPKYFNDWADDISWKIRAWYPHSRLYVGCGQSDGKKLAMRRGINPTTPILCENPNTSSCSNDKDCAQNMVCVSSECIASDNKILGFDNLNYIDNTFQNVMCCSYDLNEKKSYQYFQSSSIANVLDVKIDNELVKINTGLNRLKNPSPNFYNEYDTQLQMEEDKEYTYNPALKSFLHVDKPQNTLLSNADLYEDLTSYTYDAEYAQVLDHNILEAYQLYTTTKPNSADWNTVFANGKTYEQLYKVHSEKLVNWDTKIRETVYGNLSHKRLLSSNDTIQRTGYDVHAHLFTELKDSVRSNDYVQYYELFDYIDTTTQETCKKDCKLSKTINRNVDENNFVNQFQQYCDYPDIEVFEKEHYQKNLGLLVSNDIFFIPREDGSYEYYSLETCFDLCDAMKVDAWNDDGCVGIQVLQNSCKLLKEIKADHTLRQQENVILYTKTFEYDIYPDKWVYKDFNSTSSNNIINFSSSFLAKISDYTDCYFTCNQYNDCIGYETDASSCVLIRGNLEEVFIVSSNTVITDPVQVCAQYLSVVADCEIEYGHTVNWVNYFEGGVLCMKNNIIARKNDMGILSIGDNKLGNERIVACQGYNTKGEEILPYDPIFIDDSIPENNLQSAESDYQPGKTIFDVVRQLAAIDKPQDEELFIYKRSNTFATCGEFGSTITMSTLKDYITENIDFSPRDFGWIKYDATTTSAFTNGQFYIASVEKSLTSYAFNVLNIGSMNTDCTSLSVFNQPCKIDVSGDSFANPNKFIFLYPSSIISEAGTWCQGRRHFDLKKAGIEQTDVAKIVVERFANDILVDVPGDYQPARDLYTYCHETKGFNVINVGRWNYWCVYYIFTSISTSIPSGFPDPYEFQLIKDPGERVDAWCSDKATLNLIVQCAHVLSGTKRAISRPLKINNVKITNDREVEISYDHNFGNNNLKNFIYYTVSSTGDSTTDWSNYFPTHTFTITSGIFAKIFYSEYRIDVTNTYLVFKDIEDNVLFTRRLNDENSVLNKQSFVVCRNYCVDNNVISSFKESEFGRMLKISKHTYTNHIWVNNYNDPSLYNTDSGYKFYKKNNKFNVHNYLGATFTDTIDNISNHNLCNANSNYKQKVFEAFWVDPQDASRAFDFVNYLPQKTHPVAEDSLSIDSNPKICEFDLIDYIAIKNVDDFFTCINSDCTFFQMDQSCTYQLLHRRELVIENERAFNYCQNTNNQEHTCLRYLETLRDEEFIFYKETTSSGGFTTSRQEAYENTNKLALTKFRAINFVFNPDFPDNACLELDASANGVLDCYNKCKSITGCKYFGIETFCFYQNVDSCTLQDIYNTADTLLENGETIHGENSILYEIIDHQKELSYNYDGVDTGYTVQLKHDHGLSSNFEANPLGRPQRYEMFKTYLHNIVEKTFSIFTSDEQSKDILTRLHAANLGADGLPSIFYQLTQAEENNLLGTGYTACPENASYCLEPLSIINRIFKNLLERRLGTVFRYDNTVSKTETCYYNNCAVTETSDITRCLLKCNKLSDCIGFDYTGIECKLFKENGFNSDTMTNEKYSAVVYDSIDVRNTFATCNNNDHDVNSIDTFANQDTYADYFDLVQSQPCTKNKEFFETNDFDHLTTVNHENNPIEPTVVLGILSTEIQTIKDFVQTLIDEGSTSFGNNGDLNDFMLKIMDLWFQLDMTLNYSDQQQQAYMDSYDFNLLTLKDTHKTYYFDKIGYEIFLYDLRVNIEANKPKFEIDIRFDQCSTKCSDHELCDGTNFFGDFSKTGPRPEVYIQPGCTPKATLTQFIQAHNDGLHNNLYAEIDDGKKMKSLRSGTIFGEIEGMYYDGLFMYLPIHTNLYLINTTTNAFYTQCPPGYALKEIEDLNVQCVESTAENFPAPYWNQFWLGGGNLYPWWGENFYDRIVGLSESNNVIQRGCGKSSGSIYQQIFRINPNDPYKMQCAQIVYRENSCNTYVSYPLGDGDLNCGMNRECVDNACVLKSTLNPADYIVDGVNHIHKDSNYFDEVTNNFCYGEKPSRLPTNFVETTSLENVHALVPFYSQNDVCGGSYTRCNLGVCEIDTNLDYETSCTDSGGTYVYDTSNSNVYADCLCKNANDVEVTDVKLQELPECDDVNTRCQRDSTLVRDGNNKLKCECLDHKGRYEGNGVYQKLSSGDLCENLQTYNRDFFDDEDRDSNCWKTNFYELKKNLQFTNTNKLVVKQNGQVEIVLLNSCSQLSNLYSGNVLTTEGIDYLLDQWNTLGYGDKNYVTAFQSKDVLFSYHRTTDDADFTYNKNLHVVEEFCSKELTKDFFSLGVPQCLDVNTNDCKTLQWTDICEETSVNLSLLTGPYSNVFALRHVILNLAGCTLSFNEAITDVYYNNYFLKEFRNIVMKDSEVVIYTSDGFYNLLTDTIVPAAQRKETYLHCQDPTPIITSDQIITESANVLDDVIICHTNWKNTVESMINSYNNVYKPFYDQITVSSTEYPSDSDFITNVNYNNLDASAEVKICGLVGNCKQEFLDSCYTYLSTVQAKSTAVTDEFNSFLNNLDISDVIGYTQEIQDYNDYIDACENDICLTDEAYVVSLSVFDINNIVDICAQLNATVATRDQVFEAFHDGFSVCEYFYAKRGTSSAVSFEDIDGVDYTGYIIQNDPIMGSCGVGSPGVGSNSWTSIKSVMCYGVKPDYYPQFTYQYNVREDFIEICGNALHECSQFPQAQCEHQCDIDSECVGFVNLANGNCILLNDSNFVEFSNGSTELYLKNAVSVRNKKITINGVEETAVIQNFYNHPQDGDNHIYHNPNLNFNTDCFNEATLLEADHECCDGANCGPGFYVDKVTFDECRQECLNHESCSYFEFAHVESRCDDAELTICQCWIVTSGSCLESDNQPFPGIDIYIAGVLDGGICINKDDSYLATLTNLNDLKITVHTDSGDAKANAYVQYKTDSVGFTVLSYDTFLQDESYAHFVQEFQKVNVKYHALIEVISEYVGKDIFNNVLFTIPEYNMGELRLEYNFYLDCLHNFNLTACLPGIETYRQTLNDISDERVDLFSTKFIEERDTRLQQLKDYVLDSLTLFNISPLRKHDNFTFSFTNSPTTQSSLFDCVKQCTGNCHGIKYDGTDCYTTDRVHLVHDVTSSVYTKDVLYGVESSQFRYLPEWYLFDDLKIYYSDLTTSSECDYNPFSNTFGTGNWRLENCLVKLETVYTQIKEDRDNKFIELHETLKDTFNDELQTMNVYINDNSCTSETCELEFDYFTGISLLNANIKIQKELVDTALDVHYKRSLNSLQIYPIIHSTATLDEIYDTYCTINTTPTLYDYYKTQFDGDNSNYLLHNIEELTNEYSVINIVQSYCSNIDYIIQQWNLNSNCDSVDLTQFNALRWYSSKFGETILSACPNGLNSNPTVCIEELYRMVCPEHSPNTFTANIFQDQSIYSIADIFRPKNSTEHPNYCLENGSLFEFYSENTINDKTSMLQEMNDYCLENTILEAPCTSCILNDKTLVGAQTLDECIKSGTNYISYDFDNNECYTSDQKEASTRTNTISLEVLSLTDAVFEQMCIVNDADFFTNTAQECQQMAYQNGYNFFVVSHGTAADNGVDPNCYFGKLEDCQATQNFMGFNITNPLYYPDCLVIDNQCITTILDTECPSYNNVLIDTQVIIDTLLANPTNILELKQKVVDFCPTLDLFINTWNDAANECQNSLGITEHKFRYNQTYNILIEEDIINEEDLRLVQETEAFCTGTQFGGNCENIALVEPYITKECIIALWNTIPVCTSLRLETEILDFATNLLTPWWSGISRDLDTVVNTIRRDYCSYIVSLENYYNNNPQCNSIENFDTHKFTIFIVSLEWYKQSPSLASFEQAIKNEIDDFCASTAQQCTNLVDGLVSQTCINNLLSEEPECSDMTLDVYDIFKTQTDIPTLTTNLRQYCINYKNVKNYFNQQTNCQLVQNFYTVNDVTNIATSISSDGSDDYINDTLNSNAKNAVDNFCSLETSYSLPCVKCEPVEKTLVDASSFADCMDKTHTYLYTVYDSSNCYGSNYVGGVNVYNPNFLVIENAFYNSVQNYETETCLTVQPDTNILVFNGVQDIGNCLINAADRNFLMYNFETKVCTAFDTYTNQGSCSDNLDIVLKKVTNAYGWICKLQDDNTFTDFCFQSIYADLPLSTVKQNIDVLTVRDLFTTTDINVLQQDINDWCEQVDSVQTYCTDSEQVMYNNNNDWYNSLNINVTDVELQLNIYCLQFEKTIVVTVANGVFVFDPSFTYLLKDKVYKFDVTDATNANHPLRFRSDNTNQDIAFTETNGVITISFTKVEDITIYCTNHGDSMGFSFTVKDVNPSQVTTTTQAPTTTTAVPTTTTQAPTTTVAPTITDPPTTTQEPTTTPAPSEGFPDWALYTLIGVGSAGVLAVVLYFSIKACRNGSKVEYQNVGTKPENN